MTVLYAKDNCNWILEGKDFNSLEIVDLQILKGYQGLRIDFISFDELTEMELN